MASKQDDGKYDVGIGNLVPIEKDHATELQTSMIETLEAVEIEKQKHNSTRMEALACLAKLEVNNVAKLQQQVEMKELAQEGAHSKCSRYYGSAP